MLGSCGIEFAIALASGSRRAETNGVNRMPRIAAGLPPTPLFARRWVPNLLAAVIALFLLAASPFAEPGRSEPLAELPDWRAACDTESPFHVTACYPIRPTDARDSISVLMFRDTPNDRPHVTLAEHQAIGSVWGLAYSEREGAVYAAAYHKRLVGFGPGGPGAIYRIDIATGATAVFATVPEAGPDRHDRSLNGPLLDRSAREWVGKTSLGDLDLDETGRELFVTNLSDRRIYRFAVPGGQLLGSFAHGASSEDWAEEARPFGLEHHAGVLYHAVVRSGEVSHRPASLAAFVYASGSDGAGLRLVASVDLDGPRGRVEEPAWRLQEDLRWNPWIDRFPALRYRQFYTVHPMPMASDIEIDPDGRLILGIKDRVGDMLLLPGVETAEEGWGLGAGDVLRAVPSGDDWRFAGAGAHPYDDAIRFASHSALGALAMSHRRNVLAMTTLNTTEKYTGFPGPFNGTVYWYANDTGNKLSREGICPGYLHRAARRPGSVPIAMADNEWTPLTMHLGDLEELCDVLPSPTPTDPPTATATASPTATATPSPTASPSPRASTTPSPSASPAPTRTASATARPSALFLPLLLRESCEPGSQRVDVVLVMDASTSMLAPAGAGGSKLAAAQAAAGAFLAELRLGQGDQAALVAFNSAARTLQGLTGDRAALEAALGRLEVAQQTRIDLGIEAATGELAGERAKPGNAPVMIVLTDGRSNPVGPEVAEARAQAAKDAGTAVFTIGLGEDLDRESLARMASSPDQFHHAPTADELADIYRGIAQALPCPADAFWGRRP